MDQDLTLDAKISALKINVANTNVTNVGLQNEISGLKENISVLVQNTSDQASKISVLEDKIRTLEQNNSELGDKNLDYETQIREVMQQLDVIVEHLPEIQRHANVSITSPLFFLSLGFISVISFLRLSSVSIQKQ